MPTLWDAAHAAHRSTASVGWPVTVGASAIDTLIPEYWRGKSPGDSSNPDDRLLMNAVSRPDGEVLRIAQRTSMAYMDGNDTSIEGDEMKTVYSLDILKQHRPELMTIHLSSLDEEEHLHGPFSEEANKDLESLDGMIARLATQELANYPNAVVVVVSDHGFARVDKATNLYIPFLEAGLIQTTKSPGGSLTVTSWQAQPWIIGCMAAIMLHDPADTVTRDKVKVMLDKLAADPNNGIEAIIPHDQLASLGVVPDADFVVTLKAGYSTGGALSGPLVIDTAGRGTHGYNPLTTPEMRSSFFATGSGVARGKDLGLVDMRQIAPTLAKIMGIALPSAKAVPLPIQ